MDSEIYANGVAAQAESQKILFRLDFSPPFSEPTKIAALTMRINVSLTVK